MERNNSEAKRRNSMRLYGLAVICLLSAVCIGYLARASFQASGVNPRVTSPARAHDSGATARLDSSNPEADERAEALLARLRKSPDDALLLAEIGKIYYQMRQFSTAAEYYGRSAGIKPDAAVLVKLGGALHHNGDHEKAIGAWNYALHLDPGNPDALFNIGLVKWRAQGDRKGAIAAWQKLLETNPNHPKRAQVEKLLAQARQYPETQEARNR